MKPETAPLLQRSVPALTKNQIAEMLNAPKRSYDPFIAQEPNIRALSDSLMHYAETIKGAYNYHQCSLFPHEKHA